MTEYPVIHYGWMSWAAWPIRYLSSLSSCPRERPLTLGYSLSLPSKILIFIQLPTTFDFGTVPVIISKVAVSDKFIIVATTCGAVFVYDRLRERLRKPWVLFSSSHIQTYESLLRLRTSSSEVVSCIDICSSHLAIGHCSGMLCIIRLPTQEKEFKVQFIFTKHLSLCILIWPCFKWWWWRGFEFNSEGFGGDLITPK